MSYIELPDTIVDKVDQIQLNLPKDQKAKDLFAHLPYIANLKNPILQNRVEDLLKNRENLQNYLLATEFLGRTLEDSLLAVSHCKLNEGTKVRHLSEEKQKDILTLDTNLQEIFPDARRDSIKYLKETTAKKIIF